MLSTLAYTKLMLLMSKYYKRQKYIKELNNYVEECLREFNEDSINVLKEQLSFLTKKDCDELFSKSFWYYKLFRFGNIRLEVDAYHPKECRTFLQYNDILNLCLAVIDYEENLNLQ